MRNIKSTILTVLVALILSSVATNAHAIDYRNSQQFMRRYCLNVSAKINGLQNLLNSLKGILAALSKVNIDLGSAALTFDPPTLCLPNLDLDVNIQTPSIQGLANCMQGLNFQVQAPNLSGVASCMAALAPTLAIEIPTFDTSQLLGCLSNVNVTLDIDGLKDLVSSIAKALASVFASLKDLTASFNVKFNAAFFADIKALATLCKRAGFR